MRHSRPVLPAVALLLVWIVLGPADSAMGQRMDQFLPASTSFYVEFNNLDTYKHTWTEDQVLQEVSAEQFLGPQWWVFSQAVGMKDDELFSKELGSRIAIASERRSTDEPRVFFVQISETGRNQIVGRLDLNDEGMFGEYRMFTTPGGRSRAAFRTPWAVFADAEHTGYLVRLLEFSSKGQSLAEDKTYRYWRSQLPDDPLALGYVKAEDGTINVLSAELNNRNFHFNYLTPAPAKVERRPRQAFAEHLGPLPRTTLAAASFNQLLLSPRTAAVLDRILTPQQIEADFKPLLQPPLCIIAAAVTPDDPAAPPTRAGVAIAARLKSEDAIPLLDRIYQRAVLFLDVIGATWDAPALQTTQIQRDGVTCQVTPLGDLIEARTGRNAFAHVAFVAGRVDDWYIVATDEALFWNCVNAHRDRRASFYATPAYQAMTFDDEAGEFAQGFIAPFPMADLLHQWSFVWATQFPRLSSQAPRISTDSIELSIAVLSKSIQGVLLSLDALTWQARIAEGPDGRKVIKGEADMKLASKPN